MNNLILDNLDLSGKKVLLRIDVNSAVFNGKVIESDRIKAHSRTIKKLVKDKSSVVILAHQGNPGKKDFISLKQHSKILNKYVKVKFIDDIIGKKAVNAIKNLKKGEVLLLENVRFLKDEFKPSIRNKFVKTLKPLFDYYINDAFSVSHRNQTSIVSFPKVLKFGIGKIMEDELENIKNLKSKIKNCLFILGGKKFKDLIPLFKNKKILTGGILNILVLMLRGNNLGKENKVLKKELKFLSKIKKDLGNIKNSVDLAVSIKGKRKVFDLEDFPQNYSVFDIGNKTIKLYENEIKKSKVIFFKGALGMFEDKEFELGTKKILKAISNSKSFSIIAGGQSSDALKKFKLKKDKFGYVSLSGGALVYYLSGKELPGLKALGIKQ